VILARKSNLARIAVIGLMVLLTGLTTTAQARRAARTLVPLTGKHPPAPAASDYNAIVNNPAHCLA
jgi:hypothetical protein